MGIRLIAAWYWIRSGLWFVPSLMALASFALAWICLTLDYAFPEALASEGGFYAGGPEGARQLLSTVAGSMMTVAGVAFSITIVALSQASAQFGSRLLRNFMRDRGNQLVLGAFISTFLYCLLILRTVRQQGPDGSSGFVPQLSVTVGLVLALASLGFLIFFIHHVSGSLQADDIIARIAEGLETEKNGMFPRKAGSDWKPPPGRPIAPEEGEAKAIRAPKSGYIQSIDVESCMRLVFRNDRLIEFKRRPGDYVSRGDVLALAWPAGDFADKLERKIAGIFILGVHRTPTQDLRFSLDQLVTIALRALSPALADPVTALMCLDRLGEALVRLAGQAPASACRCDGKARLRILDHPPGFSEFCDQVLDPIRTYGKNDPQIVARIMGLLAQCARAAARAEYLRPLAVHARLIREDAAREGVPNRDKLEAAYREFLRARTAALRRLAEPDSRASGRPGPTDAGRAS